METPFLIMVLSPAQKKKDKSLKASCLRGQRLLEMGAELLLPGSERGHGEGGTARGGRGCPWRRAGCARSRHIPSLSGKAGHGGVRGDAGGVQGRMLNCVSPTSGKQLIPSPNPRPLSSSPGTEPTRLNCAHLADETSTARDLEILTHSKGIPEKTPSLQSQKCPQIHKRQKNH